MLKMFFKNQNTDRQQSRPSAVSLFGTVRCGSGRGSISRHPHLFGCGIGRGPAENCSRPTQPMHRMRTPVTIIIRSEEDKELGNFSCALYKLLHYIKQN